MKEVSLTASVRQVDLAATDFLAMLYQECLRRLPDAQTVTVSVRQQTDDADL
jgi:hypothetical protein